MRADKLTEQELPLTEHCYLFDSIHLHKPTYLGANFISVSNIQYIKGSVKRYGVQRIGSENINFLFENSLEDGTVEF